MKVCTRCKIDKEFTDFGKAKLGKDGLRAICKKCHNEINTEWFLNNKKHVSEYGKKYRQEEAERISIQRAEHTAKNKERFSEYQKQWVKNNPGKANARTARRRAARRKAMPKWLTPEHHKQILILYDEASRLTKETGIPHEVDHIIPLQGKEVKGLHVPWNLRVITASENRHKSRKIL